MIQVSGRIGVLEMERLIIILAIIISLTACESSQIEKSTDNESSVENSESNQDQIVENNTSIMIVQENDNLTYEEKTDKEKENEVSDAQASIDYSFYRENVGKGIYIVAEEVDLYKEDSSDSDVIGQVKQFNTYNFLRLSFDDDGTIWYLVRTEDDIMGWLKYENKYEVTEDVNYEDYVPYSEENDRINSYIEPIEDDIIIVATVLNVRKENAIDSEVVDKVNEYNRYKVLDTSYDENGNAWYMIKTENSITGWIAGWYCANPDTYNDRLHLGYRGEVEGLEVSMWMTEQEVISILGEYDYSNGIGGHLQVRYGETEYFHQFATDDLPRYGGISFIKHTGNDELFGIRNGMF